MPTISEFITQFGWSEFWLTFLIVALVIGVREGPQLFKKSPAEKTNLPSKE